MTSIESVDFSAAPARPVSGLFARVYADIQADRAQLPSMPDLALRVRAAMSEPNCSAASIARVVKLAPGVVAFLLKISNSPLYGGVSRIDSIEKAISRLGMVTTRQLVTAHALRSMFTTRSPALESIMRDTWRASAHVAAVAAVLAPRCGFAAERALLAGLMQDIGTLPLLHALEHRAARLPDADRIVATLEQFSPKVGVALLEYWGFDAEMVEVPRSRADWWRNSQRDADLADLILIARLHTLIGTQAQQSIPLINEVPAFFRLPLGELGPETSLALLREARGEVAEVLAMLGA